MNVIRYKNEAQLKSRRDDARWVLAEWNACFKSGDSHLDKECSYLCERISDSLHKAPPSLIERIAAEMPLHVVLLKRSRPDAYHELMLKVLTAYAHHVDTGLSSGSKEDEDLIALEIDADLLQGRDQIVVNPFFP